MKTGLSQLIVLLWAAIAASLVGLCALIVFVHVSARRMHEMDRRITENTAPSIIALESASADLSRLQLLLRERLRGLGDPVSIDARIAAERKGLMDSIERYIQLPVDPGEAAIHAELRRSAVRLDAINDRILAALPSSATARAREEELLRDELDLAAAELDTTLQHASNLSAEIQDEASQILRRVDRSLLPGTAAIDSLSVLAAVVAIIAAQRVSRSVHRASDEHRRALEQKAAELDAFSGRVAHDLLSPLMTVSMAVGFAEQRLASADDTRLRGMLSRAGSTLQRVRQMVSDLLEFARAAATPPPGAKTEVAPLLHDLVANLEPVASDAGVALTLASSSIRSVRCTAGILMSVLSNLLQNAIRHAGVASARRVVVRAIDAGPNIRFEVEDNGPGIHTEDQEEIFQPYVRRSDHTAGLGLGLATVKRLAESHGGHVGVRSEPGHGALFWVELPAARDDAGADQDPLRVRLGAS